MIKYILATALYGICGATLCLFPKNPNILMPGLLMCICLMVIIFVEDNQ